MEDQEETLFSNVISLDLSRLHYRLYRVNVEGNLSNISYTFGELSSLSNEPISYRELERMRFAARLSKICLDLCRASVWKRRSEEEYVIWVFGWQTCPLSEVNIERHLFENYEGK
jgi:hypothetical protein